MIELDHVCKVYRAGEIETAVLRNCTAEIEGGTFAVVLGVSRSGKSTLLNLIGGLDSPTSGTIRVAGRDLEGLSPKALTEFRRASVAFVFQSGNLLPTLTALENVEAGIELLGMKPGEVRRRAERYLDVVGLAKEAGKFPAQLSGGEQQRVALARALAKEPKVLLADEPTGDLDSAAADDVMRLLQRLQRATRRTFVIGTHSARFTEVADRVLHIVDGKIVAKVIAPDPAQGPGNKPRFGGRVRLA